MTIKGLDELAAQLDQLRSGSTETAKRAIFAGAKMVADKMKSNLEKVDTITASQKKDLMESLGIATIDVDDRAGINTKIGFDGYGSCPTKAYPKGLPNQLLARAIESGTSFRPKRSFVRLAVDATKMLAIKEMGRVIDEEIQKTLKE